MSPLRNWSILVLTEKLFGFQLVIQYLSVVEKNFLFKFVQMNF